MNHMVFDSTEHVYIILKLIDNYLIWLRICPILCRMESLHYEKVYCSPKNTWAHRSPLTTHRSPLPLTAHLSPLTTHRSPLTTHLSPLTTHHSPLTTHRSPLTAHRSLYCSPLTAHRSVIHKHQLPWYLFVFVYLLERCRLKVPEFAQNCHFKLFLV
jgi:hypothetical protein